MSLAVRKRAIGLVLKEPCLAATKIGLIGRAKDMT